MSLPRRRLLCLGLGLPLFACRRDAAGGGSGDAAGDAGTSTPTTTEGDCPPFQAAEDDLVLPLAEWPELAEVGVGVAVDVPEQFATLIVFQARPDCFVALWRICTHGACEVELQGGEVVCPCHGSVFGEGGEVLVGPATRPLVRWEAGRVGEAVHLRRPTGDGSQARGW